jgi:hypothetical protein
MKRSPADSTIQTALSRSRVDEGREHDPGSNIDELKRQAEISGSQLQVEVTEDLVTVNGPIDVDDVVMVVLGSVAGGP